MKHTLAVWSFVLLISLLPTSAWAKKPNPGILPPNSHPHGATYGEWAGRWLQWAFAQPAPVNPLADTTGEHCAQGQTGQVWFLAGTFFSPGAGEVAVTRVCSVPAGTALFFPVLNATWFTSDQDVVTEYDDIVEQFLVPILTCLLSGQGCEQFGIPTSGSQLAVTIDGVPVDLQLTNQVDSPYRVLSPSLDITMPLDNLFGLVPSGTGEPSCPAEGDHLNCSPGATEGIYLMLAPLSAGEHVIEITAAGYFDVTYNLTIGGGKKAGTSATSGQVGAAETTGQHLFVPFVTHQ